MDLVSMKLTPAEQKEEMGAEPQKPRYPYGLNITLDDEALEKLGLATLPAVGDSLLLTARATVTNVGQFESTDTDGPDRNLGLQITDLALNSERAAKSTAEKLYGGGGGQG